MEISEKDWKIFRSKLSEWQENHLKKLCNEYVDILTSDNPPSTKFWAIEKRIRKDKRKCGVNADMRRSKFFDNILNLLEEGVICLNDLEEFSEDVKSTVKMYVHITKTSSNSD